jgi:ribosomal-protein-alanine N-acetyltransferase
MGGDKATGTTLRIREFSSDHDAKAAAKVLRESPEAAGWSERELRDLHSLPGVSAFVSERESILSGLVVGRRMLDEGEVLNLAVSPTTRRQGEGRNLVLRLLEEFRKNGVTRVFLEVRESNRGALAFYQCLGFRGVGTRRDYYQGPLEAATVMEARLEESTD